MTDSIANGGCCPGSIRPGTYGNANAVAQITVDKCGRITKLSNVAISGGGSGSSQWTGITGNPIYYVPYVGIGSSSTPTANLQVTGNVYVSNALATTNVFATTANVGTLNVWQVSNLSTLSLTNNLYAANALTTANVHVTDTLDVLGSMTANAANATFFFDTFTIPYINTQYINVASTVGISGNIFAPTANITTLNVNSNFATTANVGTLNVWQVSNLSTLSLTNNLYAANALTTTNVFAAGFTSNVSNTNFFYSTLTVPFVYSTTLNVASTANVLTETIQGSIGQTSLNVTGNVYVSNALTTTNVFAATEVLTGTTGRTTLNVIGNVTVSNAITTTNVFTSNVNVSTTWIFGINGTNQTTFRSGRVTVPSVDNATTTTATVTFGYTAASTNYRVIATVDGGSSGFPFVVSISNKTTTTFDVKILKFINATAVTVGVDWLLIE